MPALLRLPRLVSLALLLTFWPGLAACGSTVDHGQIATTVARLLEQGHYTRQKLDEELSAQFFDNYLRLLDYNRLYLLQSDVDEFRAKYGDSLHELILRGDVSPAHEIFARFRQRVEERVAKNMKLLHETFDFSSDRTVEINRQKSAWPKDEAEADALWRNRLEGEKLGEVLSETRIDSPEEVLTRRYNQILRNVRDQEDEDIIKTFLSALAQTYDPHSDYLSPSDMENFAISMRLSLVGVGAVLRSDEGYARVMEVVPGGPADLDGRLQVNDRIAAVAQGDNPFEDTVDLKLDKVVEKIRGQKGTTVRLLVVPANATDVSQRNVIEIVRDQVQLKDQEARAELIQMPSDDGHAPARIGWITLPSFYSSNVDPSRGGERKSTTEDVSLLLNRLTAEGIDGLVIDLRRDGGGSLEEAINLTGLFIPEGPVVQVKDTNGRVSVQADNSGRTLYNGPMIVLMNRLSASASEIFAAALQDYGRALIVGDERSFGKGTVQQVIEVGRFLPFFSMAGADAGNLKLTVQKFYRVKGGSTQLRGVESDIVLPSMTDSDEIGEGSLTSPLPYDEVAPRLITPSPVGPLAFLEEIRQRSEQRVQKEPEFQFIAEDMTRLRERIETNRLSLNKKERKAENAAEKERRELRAEMRRTRGPALAATVWDVTLDVVDEPELVKVAFDRQLKRSSFEIEEPTEATEEGKEAPPVPDAVRIEALKIMQDMVELGTAGKTANVKPQS
jgi:carboxyl-terminal processing protease